MTTTRPACSKLIGLVLIGLAVSSCANPQVDASASSCASPEFGASASAPLADQIAELRDQPASFAQPLYRSPAEASPITVFVVDGERHGPVSDVLVAGVVDSVEAGAGYSWPPDEAEPVDGQPSRYETHGFNDPAAWVSTVQLVVQVEESLYLDASFDGLSSVRIGLFLLSPVCLEALRTELEGRRIAAQLINEEPAYDLEPNAFGVVGDGTLLGFVDDESGIVSFPAFDLGPWLGPEAFSSSVPLAELLQPPELVHLEKVDGLLVPVGG